MKIKSFHSLFLCNPYDVLPHTGFLSSVGFISLVLLQADNAHSDDINPMVTALMHTLCFRSFTNFPGLRQEITRFGVRTNVLRPTAQTINNKDLGAKV
jgi:hypothetical protein